MAERMCGDFFLACHFQDASWRDLQEACDYPFINKWLEKRHPRCLIHIVRIELRCQAGVKVNGRVGRCLGFDQCRAPLRMSRSLCCLLDRGAARRPRYYAPHGGPNFSILRLASTEANGL